MKVRLWLRFSTFNARKRSVCLSTGGMSAPLHAGIHPPGTRGRHPPGRHRPTQCMLGYTPPAQCMLRYTHPPAQCILGYTHPPPVQCMLGYGQEAGGAHPTGMHSCFIMILKLREVTYRSRNQKLTDFITKIWESVMKDGETPSFGKVTAMVDGKKPLI